MFQSQAVCKYYTRDIVLDKQAVIGSFHYESPISVSYTHLNPVLTLPEIQQAKPINQLAYNSSNHDIYHAYLKAVLQRNPSQRLRDADKEVVKLLHRAKLPADTIRECLMDNSLEFMMPASTGDAVDVYKRQILLCWPG